MSGKPGDAPTSKVRREERPAAARSGLWLILTYSALASFLSGMFLKGIYFVIKEISEQQGFEYSDSKALVLGLVLNLPYIPGALYSGKLSQRFSPKRILMLAALLQAVCAAGLCMPNPPLQLFWILAPIYNLANGVQWPIVESYVTAGRHGPEMRSATGWFNLVWSATIAPSMIVVGALLGHISWMFGLIATGHAATVWLVARMARQPDHHDPELAADHTGPEYGRLLVSARIILPLSYVLDCSFAPLMPTRWESLGIANNIGSMLTSVWQFSRVGAFLWMFFAGAWHGRWGVLLLSWVLLAAGFGLILLGTTPTLVIAGLLLYGVGQGTVYYAALYYGMAVGHAKVDSGGMHEALIGLGYTVGPMLALLGRGTIGGTVGVTSVVGSLLVLGGAGAIWPYVSARRSRRAHERGQVR